MEYGSAPPGALDYGEFRGKTTRNGGHPDGATSSYRKQAPCARLRTGVARPAQRAQSHRWRWARPGPQAVRPLRPGGLDRPPGGEGEGLLPPGPDDRGVDRAAALRPRGDGRPAPAGTAGRAPDLRLDPRAGPHDVRALAQAAGVICKSRPLVAVLSPIILQLDTPTVGLGCPTGRPRADSDEPVELSSCRSTLKPPCFQVYAGSCPAISDRALHPTSTQEKGQ